MSRSKQEQKKILVVEDDPGLQSQMKWCFEGYDVIIAGDRGEALNALRRHEPAVILLDLGLPPDPENASEGLATLDEILGLAPSTKVIVVTGNDERENAVKAVAKGAYDFYQKPVDPDVLGLLVQRAFHLHELEMENRQLASQKKNSPLEGIVASSPQMLKVCQTVEKVAPADITTLLIGESGTGKELVANALHSLSSRSNKRFVAINCAAIPENLLESELFGYEKGAFTGASKQTLGKIECAHGGTLMLDEIGDLPLSLQAKLLRFLQERVIERLGGREEIPIDVRVICATHQDLKQQVADGKFREDLYYRVSEITIEIPPVRERDGDAVLLARTFLDIYKNKHGRKLRGFTSEALAAIDSYDWPGNVRELENKLKRAVVLADDKLINTAELGLESQENDPASLNLKEHKDDVEHKVLCRALSIFGNNISQAAEALGVSRPTLYTLMEKHGLK